jgi:ankyrin repeat protein
MMAVMEGHFETVRLLVWEIADTNIVNERGDTALILAEKGQHTEMVKLLKIAGAKR